METRNGDAIGDSDLLSNIILDINGFLQQKRLHITAALRRSPDVESRKEVFNQIFTGEFLGREVGLARKKKPVKVFEGTYLYLCGDK